MKICFINYFFVPYYNRGGEIRLYEIAKRLVKKGHKVDIVTLKIKGRKDKENIDGINVYHIGPVIEKPPFVKIKDFIKFLFAIYNHLKRNKYDIIDTQPFLSFLPSYFFYKFRKNENVIATIHDIGKKERKDNWSRNRIISSFVEKIIYALKFKKIITGSNEIKKELIKNFGIDEKRIVVIHLGVDVELVDKIGKQNVEKDSIIFVGALVPYKHVDHLIEIVPSIVEKIPNFKLKILGTGSELEALKKMAKNYNVVKYVDFLGKKDKYIDVLKEIKKSEFLVLPSTREGFGLVLVEANACSKPVIAYASGGVKDVIKEGVNGFLIEENNKEELKEKIIFLLKNKRKAEEMGKKGRERVLKLFTWDKCVEKIEKLYKEIVEVK